MKLNCAITVGIQLPPVYVVDGLAINLLSLHAAQAKHAATLDSTAVSYRKVPPPLRSDSRPPASTQGSCTLYRSACVRPRAGRDTPQWLHRLAEVRLWPFSLFPCHGAVRTREEQPPCQASSRPLADREVLVSGKFLCASGVPTRSWQRNTACGRHERNQGAGGTRWVPFAR